MKYIFLSFAFFFVLSLFGQSGWEQIHIIPKPQSIEVREGRFSVNSETKIYYPSSDSAFQISAQTFMGMVTTATGFRLQAHTFKKKPLLSRQNGVYFVQSDAISQEEGYELEVRTDGIKITARTGQGAFYAVQTLRQLLPPAFNASKMEAHKQLWTVPACEIIDAPRFAYRGMHLDVARHFFSVDFIKKYIDLLAFHKLNTFHWHLTDDQGWRIEIPKYPKLQTVASCRNETLVGHYRDLPRTFDSTEYCGYYSVEEIKEVVEYAQKQFVTIIPEIEMPGHALAALSAYPNLGCTGGPYTAATTWGVFDDVFCAGKEETFVFLEEVLQQVVLLFPGKYIHIGGDECPKSRWKACPKCQQRMKAEGLADEHALQSYFIKRAEKIVEKQGKQIIGWDEILEGGLAPNATVMSWRGTEGGIEAAKQNHDVIMTPTAYCYFDYYQGEAETEPLAIGGNLTLEKVYDYDPMPEQLSPEQEAHILGVQGNVWTEYMADSRQVEYMAFPRVCALAEIAWLEADAKNWPDFTHRLQLHFDDLKAMDVAYSTSLYNVKVTCRAGFIFMEKTDSTFDIHYTTDGSNPSLKSRVFKDSLAFTSDLNLKAQAFKGNTPLGFVKTASFEHHKATGKMYTLSNNPNKFKGANAYSLTDGVLGTEANWGNWVGLQGDDLEAVFDFEETQSISLVKLNFLDAKTSWIWGAAIVELFDSKDGETFISLGKQKFSPRDYETDGVHEVRFKLDESLKTRFIKIKISNFGEIPEGYPGAGHEAYLFVDEIIME